MKTANGKNKLERLINKTYKYLNITLKQASNNYLIIFKINKNYVSESLWKNIEEALKGFDDIWLVSEFIKKKTIYVLQSANKHIDKNLNLIYSY